MLERLFCAVFGHRYVVERVLNHGARKVGCTRCGKHWAMHDGTRSFAQWDGEFEAFYAPGGILAEATKDAPSNVPVSGGTPSAPAACSASSYWGPDGRCVHCGAGNDAHHSYTCPTNMHPDKREPNAI